MLEQGKSVRSPPPEEEGAAETMWDELMAAPFPRPPCATWRGEAEKSGVKMSPQRMEGWGEHVLRFGLISYYPTLI